jgi:hypothetical protein
MNEFYEQVATDMDNVCDDEFITAIEGACITREEYERDPDACHARIRGAFEEMDGGFA